MRYYLFFVLSLIWVACSSSSTPEQVVLDFHNAMGHMDLAKAKAFSAPETVQFIETMENIIKQVTSTEEDKKRFEEANAEKIKEFESKAPYTCTCKDDGENQKVCEVKDKDGSIAMSNIRIEKIEGKWLIKLSLKP